MLRLVSDRRPVTIHSPIPGLARAGSGKLVGIIVVVVEVVDVVEISIHLLSTPLQNPATPAFRMQEEPALRTGPGAHCATPSPRQIPA